MDQSQPDRGGMTVLSEDPACYEAVLPSLDSWITPTERFFTRSHFSDVPQIDVKSWSLRVDGEVDRPLVVGYDELTALPARSHVVTLECAGNSRSYVTPPAEGIRFGHGAVGNAEWTGVPLHALLSLAGPRPEAVDALFEGADVGEEEEEGLTLQIEYARALPLEKAMAGHTLLAYLMNGQPLTPDHGYPVRLIVPGWYGMASVKWLRRISLLARSYHGFFQDRRYIRVMDGESRPDWEPVTSIQVKSLITRPRHGEVVLQGQFTIEGVAWSGEGAIERLEVSADGGRSWRDAELFGPESSAAWRRWRLPWTASTPGHFILMCRATDSAGNTQPDSIDWNFRGYANNSVHTIAVEVPPA